MRRAGRAWAPGSGGPSVEEREERLARGPLGPVALCSCGPPRARPAPLPASSLLPGEAAGFCGQRGSYAWGAGLGPRRAAPPVARPGRGAGQRAPAPGRCARPSPGRARGSRWRGRGSETVASGPSARRLAAGVERCLKIP